MIVYTIGNEEAYDPMLAVKAPKTMKKTGKSGDYPGGIIFLTVNETRSFLNTTKEPFWVDETMSWAIYEVEITGLEDIELFDEVNNVYALLTSSPIIKKIERSEEELIMGIEYICDYIERLIYLSLKRRKVC